MVGIPVIADQLSNVNRLVKLGVAVRLPLNEISKESLQEAITKVAENAAYVDLPIIMFSVPKKFINTG